MQLQVNYLCSLLFILETKRAAETKSAFYEYIIHCIITSLNFGVTNGIVHADHCANKE